MRLKPDEIGAIRSAAQQAFGETVDVRLFGSRTDDRRTGGDIDLLLEVEPGRATLRCESLFRHMLFGMIEEQKLDVLIHERGTISDMMVRNAQRTSVPL